MVAGAKLIVNTLLKCSHSKVSLQSIKLKTWTSEVFWLGLFVVLVAVIAVAICFYFVLINHYTRSNVAVDTGDPWPYADIIFLPQVPCEVLALQLQGKSHRVVCGRDRPLYQSQCMLGLCFRTTLVFCFLIVC